MRQMPAPRDEVDMTPSRGDVVHELLSGGVAVTRMLRSKRLYSLPYPDLSADEADLLLNFYRGIYGSGPWLYVDPSTRNVLPLDASTFGIRTQAAPGWSASSGTVALDATTAPPVDTSAVLKWSAPASTATLWPTVDVATAAPYLPNEPATFSVWLKASVAHTPRLFLSSVNSATGAFVDWGAQAAIALTTSWQRFSITVQPGSYSFTGNALLLRPALALSTSPPATVWAAAAQLEYARTVSTFSPGASVARTVIAGSPGRSVTTLGYSSHTLNLREV